jgi:hypothetical protein
MLPLLVGTVKRLRADFCHCAACWQGNYRQVYLRELTKKRSSPVWRSSACGMAKKRSAVVAPIAHFNDLNHTHEV